MNITDKNKMTFPRTITQQAEWSLLNQAHVLAATGRAITFIIKSAVLVSMSLFIGAVFAWYV